jgi:hypothetical protein
MLLEYLRNSDQSPSGGYSDVFSILLKLLYVVTDVNIYHKRKGLFQGL